VELALLLPVMMLLFAGALDLGRIFYSQITIENAAKEGALEASRNPTSFDNTKPCDKDTNRVLCLVLNEAKGSLYEITASDVTLACDPDPCPTTPSLGDTVTVKVAGHFTLVTPLLAQIVGPTVTFSASSVAQLGVQPDPGAAPTAAPTASPTAAPTASPTPTPDPSASPTTPPGPTPKPVCVTPDVKGPIHVNPPNGRSSSPGPATLFTFTAPSVTDQPGCPFTYTWSFGDGASASGPVVTHAYASAGNGPSKEYKVTLAISASGVPLSWTGTSSVRVNP
jgi:Flp pilus assembly protein TadG